MNNALPIETDEDGMRLALQMARQAEAAGEVPVGSVLVRDQMVIARGYNCPIATSDPTAHAEIITMRSAARALRNYRLIETVLYVTLEPCLMCAGAMVHARVARLVYGAADKRAGAICSKAHVLDASFLNHHVEYTGGVLAVECGEILTNFFKKRR